MLNLQGIWALLQRAVQHRVCAFYWLRPLMNTEFCYATEVTKVP